MDSLRRLAQELETCQSGSNTHLIPNLRSLHMELDIHNVDCVRPFLTKTLRHLDLFLTLNGSAWPETFQSLSRALDTTVKTCVSLESLCLVRQIPRLNVEIRDTVFSTIAPSLPHFKNLRSLNLCALPVTPSIMLIITQLQNLRCLQVDVSSYPYDPDHVDLFFRSLEEFVMESYRLHSCNIFPLEKLHSPNLTLIKAGSLATPVSDAIQNFFKALLPFKDHLLSVEVCWLDERIKEDNVDGEAPMDTWLPLDLDVFEHLFQCGKLKDIRVNAYGSFHVLDDVFLKRIWCTWPGLEVLDLGSRSGGISHPNITIRGLEDLVHHCTSLREVGVGNEFLQSLYDLNSDEPPSSAASVKHLALGSRSAYMTSQCYTSKSARYLKNLFPALETLEYGKDMDLWREMGECTGSSPKIRCVYEETSESKRWEGIQFLHYQPF